MIPHYLRTDLFIKLNSYDYYLCELRSTSRRCEKYSGSGASVSMYSPVLG